MPKLLELYRNFLFLLTLFLWAFIPLFPKIRIFDVYGTFVKIRPDDFLILFTVGVWICYLLVSGKLQSLFKTTLYKLFLAIFLVGAVSLLSGLVLTHTVVFPHLGLLHFARRFEYMILMLIVASVVERRKQFLGCLILLSMVTLTVNLYAFGQKFFGLPLISTTNSEFSKGLILYLTPGARVNSSFAGHYDLAVFLVMVLTLLTTLWWALRKLWYKVWLIILGLSSVVVLIMTAARLSFVAAVIGIAASLTLAKKTRYLLFMGLAVVLILIYPSDLRNRLISTFTINVLGLGERYVAVREDQNLRNQLNIQTLSFKTSSDSSQASVFATNSGKVASDITPGEPVDATDLGVYRSFAIRLNIEWPTALRSFIKNPLLGTGYSSLGLATDNDFLRILGETGLLGLWAFGLLLFFLAKSIWQNFRTSQDKFIKLFSAGSLAMMAAFCVNGLFIDVFEASKAASLFWMMLGLNLAVANFKND